MTYRLTTLFVILSITAACGGQPRRNDEVSTRMSPADEAALTDQQATSDAGPLPRDRIQR